MGMHVSQGRRMLSAAIALAAAGVGATACGTAGSSAPSSPLSGLSADQIAAKAIANLKTATTVRVTGDVSGSGQTYDLDVTLVRGQGCAGTMALKGTGTVKLIAIGKEVWMKPDRQFWDKVGGSNAAAVLQVLSGKYMKVKATSQLGSLSGFCGPSQLAGSFGHTPAGADQGEDGHDLWPASTADQRYRRLRQPLRLRDRKAADRGDRRRFSGNADVQRLQQPGQADRAVPPRDAQRRQVRILTGGRARQPVRWGMSAPWPASPAPTSESSISKNSGSDAPPASRSSADQGAAAGGPGGRAPRRCRTSWRGRPGARRASSSASSSSAPSVPSSEARKSGLAEHRAQRAGQVALGQLRRCGPAPGVVRGARPAAGSWPGRAARRRPARARPSCGAAAPRPARRGRASSLACSRSSLPARQDT